MKHVYVASPYTHTDQLVMHWRIRAVQHYLADTAKNDYYVDRYSPIAHWGPIAFLEELPHTVDFWHERNLAAMNRADCMEILTLPGWSASKGIQWEIKEMKAQGKEVIYVETSKTLWELASGIFNVELNFGSSAYVPLLGGSLGDSWRPTPESVDRSANISMDA